MVDTNVKIRTEDVYEILDTKIKASSGHSQLDVTEGEFYNSVLAKIAARCPSIDEKGALENSYQPSTANPFVTQSDLTRVLTGALSWKTIGPTGGGADYQGATAFTDAFSSGYKWFYLQPSDYILTDGLIVPDGVRLVGGLTRDTRLILDTGTAVTLGDNAYLGFLSVLATGASNTALDVSSTVGAIVNNCVLTSGSLGKTAKVDNASHLMLVDCALMIGNVVGANLADSIFESLYVDASGTYGINLEAPNNLLLWSSTFFSGTPNLTDCVNVRVVANHFTNSIDVTGSVIKRANTPSAANNEDESLTHLLQYLGSLSTLQTNPAYSSNFAGPQGQDITARASALDIILQWRYEERNFSLIAETEPMVVTWSPSTSKLTTSGGMRLVSAHRSPLVWELAQIVTADAHSYIPNGHFLYYIIDRTITANTILTPHKAPLGSFPDLNTNEPLGTPENRQIWVLALNTNGTLWWRGGKGSRFSAKGNQTGEYFIDGTSKSLLTYLGSNDYNDSDPNYSNNFAGVQGESLTTRLGKTDTLIKRLFEFSNLSYHLAAGSFISSEANSLLLTGELYFILPHTNNQIQLDPLSTLATTGVSLADGDLLYLTWDQDALFSANQIATVTKATTVPLPDQYPLATKYFLFAVRSGYEIILWDGTKLPIIGDGTHFAGGRWPLPTGRAVIRTAAPSVLSDNVAWDGTNILWENLAVSTATGVALNRNTLANQTSASNGLTNLTDGTGLVISHTWNSGSAQSVSINKVTLSTMGALAQNQFLWAYNRGGYLFFMR